MAIRQRWVSLEHYSYCDIWQSTVLLSAAQGDKCVFTCLWQMSFDQLNHVDKHGNMEMSSGIHWYSVSHHKSCVLAWHIWFVMQRSGQVLSNIMVKCNFYWHNRIIFSQMGPLFSKIIPFLWGLDILQTSWTYEKTCPLIVVVFLYADATRASYWVTYLWPVTMVTMYLVHDWQHLQ